MDKIKILNKARFGLKRGTPGAVGWDLHTTKRELIAPGETVLIPTGVYVELPEGVEGSIRPRSSISKQGILVHYGTIDQDYRGEIKICCTNLTTRSFSLFEGGRIAQVVFSPVFNKDLDLEFVEELNETCRGHKGFGSTGA